MGTERWNVSEDKETLHGNPHGYGQGIKGKDEKQQKKAFDKNRKKAEKGDSSAYEPTAIDKKVMAKREKGEMPKAKKSKYTEGLFDFNPRKKIMDPSMFSSKKDDISMLIKLQQKALAMKPGDSKRAAIFKEINKVKQRLGIAEDVTIEEIDMFLEDCWPGYKAVGLKDKNGKKVPNCVPENTYKKLMSKTPIEEDSDKALANKAKESGEPLGDLKKVYKKGLAAYASGHRPGMTQHQWAMARVNSYIKGGKAREVDAHIRKESKQSFAKFNSKIREEEQIDEAEYQGREVKLNKPMQGDVKKSKVYVKNEKGNVVKVNFGDPNMTIKKDDPGRRASFRARHNCDDPGPKTGARYWSCKAW